MIFSSIIQNKVTEFTCRHGDKVCKVTYEYDIESMEDMVAAFETIARFMGYSENDLAEWYRAEE